METEREIIEVARGLVSEDGENPEYDRALVEMTSELLGLPLGEQSTRTVVEFAIGVKRRPK